MENKKQTVNTDRTDEKLLSVEEQEMIQKGKNHWSFAIPNKRCGGYVDSRTIKELIDKVIENTWTQAKVFYNKE